MTSYPSQCVIIPLTQMWRFDTIKKVKVTVTGINKWLKSRGDHQKVSKNKKKQSQTRKY